MSEVKEGTKVTPEAAGNPKIVWDDSSMATSYANVCNVLGTREEIMVLFGANQAWQADSKEVTVNLSNRIVLNPYAAKRLQTMLEMALKEYETRYGQLKI
ncbi:hypothetical protein Mmc1_2178 [Magnetococcus marinus MC-1]|uniref:DUF3467 domain-containing protein n=1 Tax=Magnetococcus marinus (strain ATCC BAA-1437 / JCM 17883 / MC-1) TaxID=156889 RepID=A0L9N6_MAGMM|nr:DUF3467 domain-containing protein [Magnetococcus marinus]ABK44679.1 hypothetical protein Mmc1_2178 [Magnetococcus marinus MC-1]